MHHHGENEGLQPVEVDPEQQEQHVIRGEGEKKDQGGEEQELASLSRETDLGPHCISSEGQKSCNPIMRKVYNLYFSSWVQQK